MKKIGNGVQVSKEKEFTYSAKVIGNLCLYQCQKCHRMFKTRISLGNHHKKNAHTEKLIISDCIKTSVYHKCRICQTTLLCELRYVRNHVVYCHGLSLEKYCARTGCALDKDMGKRRHCKHDNRKMEETALNNEDLPFGSNKLCLSAQSRTAKRIHLKFLVKRLCKEAPQQKL